MSKHHRKYLKVEFDTSEHAEAALKALQERYPTRLAHSEDLSKVHKNTVFFQSDSTYEHGNVVKDFLHSCAGAFPADV